MELGEALKKVKEGKRVEAEGTILYGEDHILYCQEKSNPLESRTRPNLLAGGWWDKDWQIVEEKKKENKITFEKVSDTKFNVLLDGEVVGDVWSKLTDGGTPHTGKGNIQICGFYRVSEVWGCSRYNKSKDMCLDFKR